MTETDQASSQKAPPWSVRAEFILGATGIENLPPPEMAEVAFAGRSNVGKSTLLNALAGLRNLARTSNTPGRTRQLNYFSLQEQHGAFSCYLVDLPGYGYARVSKTEVRGWTRLVKDYMRGRPNLRRVFLLIDARRGLMKADHNILSLLKDAGVSTQIVMTKCDKLKAGELKTAKAKLLEDLKPYVIVHPEVHVTSGTKNRGIDALRNAVMEVVKG